MMLTAAVTLAMATSTASAAASGGTAVAAPSCDEAALDHEYDNCVALLHTGKEDTHERNRNDPHEYHFTHLHRTIL